MGRKNLVIIGASGAGRDVLWQLTSADKYTNQYNVLGFVDEAADKIQVNGYPILGDDEWLVNYPNKICAVIGIGSGKLRKKIYQKLRVNPNISFPVIIPENVQYSDTVAIGQGSFIGLSSILAIDASIGEFVYINLSCIVEHDAKLDDFATLNPGTNIAGNVHIGACAEIGIGSNIIQGKSIGENTIIGAGSVVINDIPPNCTAVGIPAKPIKYHYSIV